MGLVFRLAGDGDPVCPVVVAVLGAPLVDEPVELGQGVARVASGAGHQLVQQPGGAQGDPAAGDGEGGEPGGVERGQGPGGAVVDVGVPGVGEARPDQ